MDSYLLLRFAHFLGFILLGGGLLGVFMSELRAYRTSDPKLFAEAAWYAAILYDALALPGAILLVISGGLLTFELGYGFFEQPWLTAMWGLFLFEFIEGNTVTRIQFRRTLSRSRDAVAGGALSPEDRHGARTLTGQIAHFLDAPLFSVIVYCGVMRPGSWSEIVVAIGLALIAAAILTALVPRMAARSAAGP